MLEEKNKEVLDWLKDLKETELNTNGYNNLESRYLSFDKDQVFFLWDYMRIPEDVAMELNEISSKEEKSFKEKYIDFYARYDEKNRERADESYSNIKELFKKNGKEDGLLLEKAKEIIYNIYNYRHPSVIEKKDTTLSFYKSNESTDKWEMNFEINRKNNLIEMKDNGFINYLQNRSQRERKDVNEMRRWLDKFRETDLSVLIDTENDTYKELFDKFYSFNEAQRYEMKMSMNGEEYHKFREFHIAREEKEMEMIQQSFQSIDKKIGLGKEINLYEKLNDNINERSFECDHLDITLKNKRTEQTADFSIHFKKEDDTKDLSPIVLQYYEVTLRQNNGQVEKMHFEPNEKGEIPKAKEAISLLNKQMLKTKKEDLYAYLRDDFGITTDISHKIRNMTEEDVMNKETYVLDRKEYLDQFMLDISKTGMEGTLVTNAIYIDCSESDIMEIDAPKADEIQCEGCHYLEKITAENCHQVSCEDTPLLKLDNMELHPDCNIDGLKETHQLKR